MTETAIKDVKACASSAETMKRLCNVTAPHHVALALILIIGLMLRLSPFVHFESGIPRLVGTCGQLFDEAQPLFDSKNPLHFEVFFYPPVPAMLVASTALIIQAIIPKALNFASYCLWWNIVVSALIPLAVYRIGREWSAAVGLLAASFFVVTMIAVYSSDNVQMYPTLFAMLAVIFFFKSLRYPTNYNLALLGVLLGLAVASKYFPIMLFLMLFLVHYEVRRKGLAPLIGVDRDEVRRTDAAITAMIWGGLLLSGLVLASAVLGRAWLLGVFKAVYESHSHDHPFEYHTTTIQRLYVMALVAVAAIVAGLTSIIVVSSRCHVNAGYWFRSFLKRNVLWAVPVASMATTIIIALGIPAALNLNNYLKYTSWIAKTYASADGGFFPGARPAPSYFFSYFPENLGVPLFLLSCLGIVTCVLRHDRKALLLLVVTLPLYGALELSSVKVNRFAMDLMPILCLFAALALAPWLQKKRHVMVKVLAVVVFALVFSYSALYSLAWAGLQRSLPLVPVETARWVSEHVPPGSAIGLKAQLWIDGSPNLLPDPRILSGYRIVRYTDDPDYILVPKSLLAIMRQYADLRANGYIYTVEDWAPLPPPAPGEAEVLLDLIRQSHYDLLVEIERRPTILGWTFLDQAFTGKTWLLEHTGSYGIQVYRKRSSPESAARSALQWSVIDEGRTHV